MSGEYLFPEGLPGFDQERRFRLVRQAEVHPFVTLESQDTPGLRFICMPPGLLWPGVPFALGPEQMEILGTGKVVWLVIVAFPPTMSPVANLLAPLALNAETGRGIQAIQVGSGLSAETPLHAENTAC